MTQKIIKMFVICMYNDYITWFKSTANQEYLMVTSSINAVLQSSSFVNKMLFHGKTNAISVTVDM